MRNKRGFVHRNDEHSKPSEWKNEKSQIAKFFQPVLDCKIRLENSRHFTLLIIAAFLLIIGPCFVQTQKVIININGNWSPWSTVNTPCNASCGGGVKVKVRSCTNPRPQGMDAADCQGIDKEFFPCNMEPCDMQWSTWSPCSANCGRGMRMRHTRCAKERGGELFECEGEQYFTHTENCNSWVKDPALCASPCEGYECMDFGACVDVSTEEDPVAVCECQMGKIFDDSGLECVDPPATTPTPRPIPTMKAAVKAVASGMTKTASTLLIVFVTITLVIFGVLKIFDHGRVIQMNMEIALISAHICLLIEPPPEWMEICRLFSILIHLFFTTCFVFMCLESLHTYSLVAFVVKKNGLLTKMQNIVIGWGVGLGITLVVVSLEYKNYGGEYHCWLAMDTTLMIGQYVPIVLMVVLTLTLIEAAGAAEYRKLPGIDQRQQTSAKIMQRSNLIIMPMVFVSFLLGTLSSYEQNPGLYGTFTLVNGILGGSIFFFHSTGNEQVRAKLMRAYKTIIKKEKF
eukprot:TRINITY_DN7141_c0_g1_i1.p1 TRINITY_DN7141_c0_g1~~TRINITY_DN7141_c0_g1_i1.p1  ORF type:complete len:514 (-),score=67.49 TRINITY_DN7141_c0_g1_i1:139-1680(-)